MTQDQLSLVVCGERGELHRAWSVLHHNRSDPLPSMSPEVVAT